MTPIQINELERQLEKALDKPCLELEHVIEATHGKPGFEAIVSWEGANGMQRKGHVHFTSRILETVVEDLEVVSF